MPVIEIIAKETVPYSLDNGIHTSLFDPGKEYEVPKFAADGMVARGWAKLSPDRAAAPAEEKSEEPEPAKGKRRSS
jgi:hypothetical protein